MVREKVAVCVRGYCFFREFYEALFNMNELDIYIISHAKPDQIPGWLQTYQGEYLIDFQPDYGEDWGCYQQFLDRCPWKQYKYIFFMHDDMEIRKNGFVEKSIQMLDHCRVVGNGRNSIGKLRSGDLPHHFGHANWYPPHPEFRFNSVRGSFFATTSDVIERLGRFEVFWNRFCLQREIANWSLTATCAKLEYLFGESCFGYLGEHYRESEYLFEYERGKGRNGNILESWQSKVKPWRIIRGALFRIIKYFSAKNVKTYWSLGKKSLVLTKIISLFAKI